ncbi:hypothetical protein BAZ12_11185 [Elizabethkingia miricola]|uniref:Uncharacterized protein n=1 Tax=Elizabethkingia miricola TaxID=172045 RepID=A0AAP1C2D5_ELIMR|nr:MULTISPECIES: hypothetical protein [Elizabethkingia]KUY20516.1 hypothetical protein ATB95_06320 [Elizabethkingia miricola]MCL1653296.1 hypothetical protein [Elizabethkingia miricola]OPC16788.1 hypothetical protein BAY01_03570 [Elizabethkingia miricola]OPC36715.1 hypothetical protein BAX99_17045 [Elizabethkingia miricola]OPC70340.1 hypothetical protein BAZ12_11185 [Elizabethkingia miricola]
MSGKTIGIYNLSFYTLALIVSPLLCLSCSSVVKSSKTATLTTDYCKPNFTYQYPEIMTNAGNQEDSVLIKKLPAPDYALSKNIGILPLLSQYNKAKDPLKILIAKQKISDQLMITNSGLNAMAAESDCNGERIQQLSNYLGDINNKNIRKLTVGSIILGATIAVSSSLINNNNTNKAINIGGGAAGAALGLLTLNPKGRKIQMDIQRNLLRNVWNNDNSDQAFPPDVWSILNEKSFSNSGDKSMRETLKDRWLLYAFDGKPDPETLKLFFGNGGTFRADDLQTMSNMYNELQASIRSVQQNMQSLMLKINTLNTENK